ncbi:MAG: glycosyltransferase family 4 protein [Hoeflea sp.]|uniref:glycosyltransferase n=1 Tax=Hoeflea sp. TaxID=1940281 RepID=UPI001D71193E|nr:glycosyltransferase family 4 protein [Hoeflea sp.]MBU4528947.1 glycosyltransferase family 4 protein [Alphaproteobacteria bacterium]MBU4544080.1 glycosyltransferase family 4 protein [Alphaproteobacteria bacterium]MBU4551949.1 glycosyltransferase family 4 protein [Alphaproteobacteria bacterium]MBV1723414.1 glycosyltransferase family 4 protein [Hoeflea sp.]MBV1760393.1 glycosyltransferase family 4 protein [Hoeflea sp.]
MHFVFISSLVPVQSPASGYDIANRVIVDAIRLLGHKVSVLGFLQPGRQPAAAEDTRLLGQLEVTNARVTKLQKALWLKDAVVHGEPVSVAKMHAARPAEIRAALGALGQIDGLILNSVQLPGAFLDIFSAWPLAFIAHNVEARSAADNARGASDPLTRFLFARDARLLAGLEQKLCIAARHVFTLAEADRAELGVGDDTRSTALPLVTSVTPPGGPAPRAPLYDAGMIGSWTWAANRAGLDWFLTDVVPRLPSDFRIAIAGGTGTGTPPAPDNVSFLGRVDDARAFVRSCRIIPLISRTGTGVQLKTIETFEMGLPSVATANALRGISQVPGNCVTADDPGSFAAALIDMVGRSRAGEGLDTDGRTFHQQQLSGLSAALARGLSCGGWNS